MNENDAIVSTEQVAMPAPEDENNVATANEETATGTATEDAETTDTTAEEEANTAAQVATPAQEDAEPEAQPFALSVRYKGEDVNLTAEEAKEQVERGRMYHEKLHRLASDCGKDVKTFINDLYKASEDATYNRLLEEAGGNESIAKRLLELEQQKQNAAYKKAREEEKAAEQAAKDSLNDRLASDFIELQAEFPEYGKFSDLPKAVVKMAVDKNISLYDALLRHERAESKKIDTAKQQQAQAAAASVGSQAAQPPEKSPNPTLDALMAGLRRGLG